MTAERDHHTHRLRPPSAPSHKYRPPSGRSGAAIGGQLQRRVVVEAAAIVVGVVRLAAQRAADDLLAEELRAEGADAQHVRDGPGVPALGEHRDGDDAADRSPSVFGFPTVFITSRSKSW